MNKFGLVATAAAMLGAGMTSTAFADIPLQGPQLTGIALQSMQINQPVVTTVTLRSGETVVLRPQATD